MGVVHQLSRNTVEDPVAGAWVAFDQVDQRVHHLGVELLPQLDALDGQPVVLANVDGAICAFGGICTHADAPLGKGKLRGDVVECPFHGGQFEVRTGTGWQVAAASQPGWRTAPSHITAADLIGGQCEDQRRLAGTVHDLSFDDRTWREAVARDVDVAIVRSVAPPVRRVEEIRPAAVRGRPFRCAGIRAGYTLIAVTFTAV